jgi:tRNA(adenine34) deaminase
MSRRKIDTKFMRRAIELALAAEAQGNLPIGVVISLGGEIVAQGCNAIFSPVLSASRHAEMEALTALPVELRERGAEMTLYTTLEPCLMCLAAILLHRIGRVVFGSADYYGAGATADQLPRFFAERFAESEWVGPAFPAECDPLYERIKVIERGRGIDFP